MSRKSEMKPATPASPPPAGDTATEELRERIERLEKRMDASIEGDDGLAELDRGIDRSECADPLQKAVSRSNLKRGRRKA